MAGEIKTLGKHSLIYGIGIILGKLTSFIMLPIYTHYLTPADYGVLEMLSMTIEVAGMVVTMGFLAGLYKFYSEAKSTREQATVVGTAAVGMMGLALLGSLLGLAAAVPLNHWVIGEHGTPGYVRLFFLIYFFQSCEYVPLALIRAQNRSTLFIAINLTKLVTMLSLNIVTVVVLHLGVLGIMISTLVAETALAIGLSAFMLRSVGFHFSREKFRIFREFGRPMIFWSLGNFVLVFSDRFFVNHFSGTAQVGIYSLAYQFAFVLSALAYSPFATVWEPRRFEIVKRPDAQDIYSRVFLYMNIVLGLCASGVALFVHDFLKFMSDPSFLPAASIVPILVTAQIAWTWVGYCNLGLYIEGQAKLMGNIAIAAAVVTLTLNFALIPFFGMWGAAAATLTVYSLRFALVYHFSQRAYHIDYRWSTVLRLYSALATAVVLHLVIAPAGVLTSIAWSGLLFFAAAAYCYAQVLRPWERKTITGLLAASRVRLRMTLMGA